MLETFAANLYAVYMSQATNTIETGQNLNLPEDLKGCLGKFSTDLPRLIGDNLIGIYIYGSISYGDFLEASSDVDIMVLTKDKLTQLQLSDLEKWYKSDELKSNRWITRLEMDYAPIGFASPDPMNNFETTRFAGGKLLPTAKFERACIDWENIREKGITLFGQQAKEIIPQISQEKLTEALKDKFHQLKSSSPEWEKVDLWNQAFIIVQLCRVAYMLKHGGAVSKRQAARWCSENLPEDYRQLALLGLDKIDNWSGQRDDLITKQLPNFIQFIENQFPR